MPVATYHPGSGPDIAGQGFHAGYPAGGTGACWCQAGRGCRTHHPRHSMGPGPDSTLHTHCRKSHTDAAAAEPHPASSPRTAFAGEGYTQSLLSLGSPRSRWACSPLAFLRSLPFASYLPEPLECIHRNKMFITHTLYTCAKTCRGRGRCKIFSLKGHSRLSLLLTFALHLNGLYPDLP